MKQIFWNYIFETGFIFFCSVDIYKQMIMKKKKKKDINYEFIFDDVLLHSMIIEIS